jgi:hypothetical protein
LTAFRAVKKASSMFFPIFETYPAKFMSTGTSEVITTAILEQKKQSSIKQNIHKKYEIKKKTFHQGIRHMGQFLVGISMTCDLILIALICSLFMRFRYAAD